MPETPQQNKVAERVNRTLVEMKRCLLIQAKLPKHYWVKALSTAAHIRNLTVIANSKYDKSPFEIFIGKLPRRNHLRIFWMHSIFDEEKGQLKEARFEIGKSTFIGYSDKSTAYILQEFDSKRVVKARNVLFKKR